MVAVVISWLVVRWLLLQCYPVQSVLVGGYSSILPSRPLLIVIGGLVRSLGRLGALLCGLLLGCTLLTGAQVNAANLAWALREEEVSSAWGVWSSAEYCIG